MERLQTVNEAKHGLSPVAQKVAMCTVVWSTLGCFSSSLFPEHPQTPSTAQHGCLLLARLITSQSGSSTLQVIFINTVADWVLTLLGCISTSAAIEPCKAATSRETRSAERPLQKEISEPTKTTLLLQPLRKQALMAPHRQAEAHRALLVPQPGRALVKDEMWVEC